LCASCGRVNPEGQRFCDGCGERLSASSPDVDARATIPDAPTLFLHGRYRMERFLGEGAHKRVYLAQDMTLGRNVAVAFIKTETSDADLAERVRREAKAMGRLSAHPNLVTVYDAGEDDGRPFIVEEYVDGGTLAEVLGRARGRLIGLEPVLGFATDVCAALVHAHGHGIVHRDLKPANVWLTSEGTAKLGDFGLVAALRASQSDTLAKLTAEGNMVGTVAYMAPEQALGHQLDPRSDLYSFGVLLYELVTGRLPFAGDDTLAILSQHLRTPPVAPAWHNKDIPRPLNELILALLAKDPRDRPAGAVAVHGTLEAMIKAIRERRGGDDVGANPLEGLAGGVYVGRETEIDELCGSLDHAMGGRGQVVLIAGEPGIGKTRLVEQLTTYAHLRETAVLWGRCYEGEGAPPYWPWTQVIRAYTVEHDPELLAAVMGVGAADIAQMVSEVRRRLPDLPEPPSLGAEQARFRLFASVTTFLRNASFQEPLIVVLDDIHRADRSSLQLLEFLAQEVGDTRLLVVGTYRDVELHPGHVLTHTLGELARARPRRITLRGLSSEQVARYIHMVTGVEPDERLVGAVHGKSEGNPFFVSEIVRLLSVSERLDRHGRDSDAEVAIPSEVREIIGRRVERLAEPCRAALSVAAVIGRDFAVPVLQQVVGVPTEQLLEALDEAAAAHVIDEVDPGRYRFSHVLICDTLAESLPAGKRMHLHARIGASVEQAFAVRLGPHLSELAHHYLEALPAGDLDKALHYATAAAQQAGGRLAHEEAARLYQRALGALGLSAAGEERRCDLLLSLGEANAHAGAADEARSAFREAVELARRLPSPQRLAGAALGFGGPRPSFGVVDEELVGLLEEALSTSADLDRALRARLLARLAMELSFTLEQERRATLVDEAIAEARQLDDAATIAYALNAQHAVLWGPANTEERLAIASEAVALAERAGDRQLACEGRNHRIVALLEIGDVTAAAAEIDAHARLAEELRQPFALWQAAAWRSTIALLEGRTAEGQAYAENAFALGQRVRATDAEHCFAIQSLVAAMDLGHLGDLLETLQVLADDFPATRWRDAGLPYVFAELGRREEAAQAFEATARAGFAALPRDYQWLVSMTAIADACAFIGDARRATELYELMLPYAGRSVFMPEGWACFGSTDRALGVLAATMQRWESAEEHFEAALALDTRMGARAWRVRTELGYVRMLLARATAADGERVRALLSSMVDTTHELGLTGLVGRVEVQLAAATERRQPLDHATAAGPTVS
jgi:predicted ATPase